MPKIVYHGTFSDAPPEDWAQETFHAGTKRSAYDRLSDEEAHGIDWDEIGTGIARGYAYEVSDTAPMSKVLRDDPMFPETPGMEVPEDRTDKIYPYKNAREDEGSTSYVIPTGFVGRHVKPLGLQFQYVVGGRENEKAVMNAITAMSGGRVK